MKKLVILLLISTFCFFGLVSIISASEKQLQTQEQAKEEVYWLNTNSNVRHNKKCRWYGKTKEGRYTKKKEGRACKICGG